MRYEGDYRDGVRDGLWRVTDVRTGDPLWEVTWSAGEWHGPARTWYRSGQVEDDGQHSHGERDGVWTFWFESGQVAARGSYAEDKKIGEWKYWAEDGEAMQYDQWERAYHDYDWAYDDYTGMPRGENWPEPPSEGRA